MSFVYEKFAHLKKTMRFETLLYATGLLELFGILNGFYGLNPDFSNFMDKFRKDSPATDITIIALTIAIVCEIAFVIQLVVISYSIWNKEKRLARSWRGIKNPKEQPTKEPVKHGYQTRRSKKISLDD
jgi:NADH:ubiquinone oxidoreductase subunit 5 (subunit L)/multisubunit Na+/H+ antiporter MnhA subunit